MSKIYPFKFLDSYSDKDTGLFFGRDEEIKKLYELVSQANILTVYGASGTGKTSLIQCGLASKFRVYDWLPLYVRRGSDLNDSLADALVKEGGRKGVSIEQSLNAVYLNSFRPIYLIFDQFEELFIIGTENEEKKKAEIKTFIETTQQILKLEQPVKMIFSIREEYVGYLYDFEMKVPQLMRRKLRVEPMKRDKVVEVIKKACSSENSNISLEPGQEDAIAGLIFDKIKGTDKTLTIPLPYLQVFMDKLYMEATHDTDHEKEAVFKIAAIRNMGAIDDILRDFLDSRVKAISAELSTADNPVTIEDIWRVLSPFATLEGTKEPIALEEVYGRLAKTNRDVNNETDNQANKELSRELIKTIVEAFESSRILRRNEVGNTYELAHDSLAKEIADNRSGDEVALLGAERIINSQLNIKKEIRGVLPESQLNVIKLYWAQLEPRLNDEAKELIKKSEDAIKAEEEKEQAAIAKENAEKERKLRVAKRLYGAGAVVIILLSGLTFWAWKLSKLAEQKTRGGQSAALSGLANYEIYVNHDPNKGFKYAEYAYGKDSGNLMARKAIYSCIFHSARQNNTVFSLFSIRIKYGISSALFSNDDSKILIKGVHSNRGDPRHGISKASVLDAKTGDMLDTFQSYSAIALSPDASKVFKTVNDSDGMIYDIASKKELVTLREHWGRFCSATFAPDGKILATVSARPSNPKYDTLNWFDNYDGYSEKYLVTVQLWNSETGQEIKKVTYPESDDIQYSFVFSVDTNRLLLEGNKFLELWDTRTGKELCHILHNSSDFNKAEFIDGGEAFFYFNRNVYEDRDKDTLILRSSRNGRKLVDTDENISWYRKQAKFHNFSGRAFTSEMMAQDDPLDYSVKMSYTEKGQLWATTAPLPGYSPNSHKLLFSHHGGSLMSTFYGGWMQVWATKKQYENDDLAYENFLPSWFTKHNHVSAISRSGGMVFFDSGGVGNIWNLNSNIITQFGSAVKNMFYSPYLSEDGTLLLTSSKNRDTTVIWNTTNGKQMIVLPIRVSYPPIFSPGNTMVLIQTENDDHVLVHLSTRRQIIFKFGYPCAFRFYPGDKFVSATIRDSIKFYDAMTGNPTASLFGVSRNKEPGRPFVSRDGKKIAFLYDKAIHVYNTNADAPPVTITQGPGKFKTIEFSADGLEIVAVADSNNIKLWDAKSGKILAEIDDKTERQNSAHFSPNGEMIITNDGYCLNIWDSKTGKKLLECPGTYVGDEEMSNTFITNDSRMLMTYSFGEVSLWDISSKKPLARISVPIDGSVGSREYCFFSDDNKKIIAYNSRFNFDKIIDIDPASLIKSVNNKIKLDDLPNEEKEKYGIPYKKEAK
jgi:WD40 repeat protein